MAQRPDRYNTQREPRTKADHPMSSSHFEAGAKELKIKDTPDVGRVQVQRIGYCTRTKTRSTNPYIAGNGKN